MRFRITLTTEKQGLKLPYNYNHVLASVIYSFLEISDLSFSEFLHDTGYREENKTFKLFTFSPLLTHRRTPLKDKIVLYGKIEWYISSPKEEFVSHLVEGMLSSGCISLLGQELLVEEVMVVEPPSFAQALYLHTLSPIAISTGEKTERFESNHSGIEMFGDTKQS